MYVFDTNALQALFKLSTKVFQSLWEEFDSLASSGQIISVKEVYKEIENGGEKWPLFQWAKQNKGIFQTATKDEALFVKEIFKVSHFQKLPRKQFLMDNKPIADPFIIAKAKVLGGTVITLEGFEPDGSIKPNAPKIPNICQHFKIECLDLNGFMEKEDWQFELKK